MSRSTNLDIIRTLSAVLREKEIPAPNDFQLERWFTTNEAPPDAEARRMQQHMDAQLTRLSALNKVLMMLPIPAILDEQSRLQESIMAYRTVLHPMRKIPPEILQCIFELCLPKDCFQSLDPYDAPLIFTRVSRRWRSAALSMHELWSSLDIHIPMTSGVRCVEEVRFHVTSLKRWFARAKTKPMSITLCSPADYDFKYQEEYQLPRAILDHSSFIRALHIQTSKSLLAVLVGGQLRYQRSWPLLEEITLGVMKNARSPVLSGWVCDSHNSIWEAPNLKAVTWLGATANTLYLPLKWHQLQVLRVSGVVVDPRNGRRHVRTHSSINIRHMLQATPNLVVLQVTTDASSERYPDDWFGIRVPRNVETTLRRLTMLLLDETHSSSPLLVPSIFYNLQLPALTYFGYRMIVPPEATTPATDNHPLICFLRQQNNPIMISNWYITTASLSPLGIVEALKLMPQLVHLTVWRDDGDPPYIFEGGEWDISPGDWMLDVFHCHGPASACPKLRTLSFDAVDFTVDGMRRFVAGRKRLAAGEAGSPGSFVPLEAFTVRVRQPDSSGATSSLRGWISRDLEYSNLGRELQALGVKADIRFESVR